MYFLRGSLPWQGLKADTKKQKYERISEKKMTTSIEALCRSYPNEFSSYFHYCRSLRFDDRPDYAYLKRIFRDLFIREGFQFDYVFDWTILKYQQSQIRGESHRSLAGPGGPSNAMPASGSGARAAAGAASGAAPEKGTGQEGRENRDASWFLPSRRAPSGTAGGGIQGYTQRSPGIEDSGPSKEAVEEPPHMCMIDFTRPGSSSRKAVVSSSQPSISMESTEPSRSSASKPLPTSLRTPSAQRGSTVSSSDQKRTTCTSTNMRQYESVVRGIDSLTFDKEERH
eukprot:c21093_g1_i3 orf=401-1252(-)